MNTRALGFSIPLLLALGALPARALTAPAPAAALQDLKQGNERFVSGKLKACLNVAPRRAELTQSQSPEAIVLSCSDSRVPPEQVFDQGLGRVFTVRLAGNVLTDEGIASIEYAVEHLHVPLILVLGHESCGAVKEALNVPEGKDAGSPSLNKLLSEIRANLGDAKADDPKLRGPVKKNVSAVADSLPARSEIVRKALGAGSIKIQRGIYDLGTGRVELW
jgi:carbonic anhydrase